MKKYFLNDGTGQQGPFSLEELKEKNLKADSPVWYEGLPDWTTVGALDELKDVLMHTPPPYHASQPVEEVKPAAAVTATPVAAKAAEVKPASKSAANSSKKKTAWLSWVLYALVLGGVGYFVYDSMQKDKAAKGNATASNGSGASADSSGSKPMDSGDGANADVATNNEVKDQPAMTDVSSSDAKVDNPPVATTSKTTQPVVVDEKAKANIVPSKADAQKLAAQKKAEEEKKKQAAQAAALAKEKEYRNNWTKYVTVGNYKANIVKNDDGVEAFNIPVYNNTNATLDKVILQVDYWKKEKKVKKSETVTIYGIPPGGGLNGQAPASNKGNNIEVKITGVTSRKLHFCYPNSGGKADDPYYCN